MSRRVHQEARAAWESLVGRAQGCFSAPSFAIFTTILAGWVLAPGRRTITAMVAVADPAGRRAHDAYHRFLRAGRWSTAQLWKALVVHLVATLCPTGSLNLDVDDTVYKESGGKIDGAGSWRDAVRSTKSVWNGRLLPQQDCVDVLEGATYS